MRAATLMNNACVGVWLGNVKMVRRNNKPFFLLKRGNVVAIVPAGNASKWARRFNIIF